MRFFLSNVLFTFRKREANIDVESRIIFPNEFLKICERLQSGQLRHFASNVYHESSSYIPFVRSFDDCGICWGCNVLFFKRKFRRSSSTRQKTEKFTNLWIFNGVILDCKNNQFSFFYIWRGTFHCDFWSTAGRSSELHTVYSQNCCL